MTPETLLFIMASAIVVAAAAIVLQAVILVAMFLATRSMRNQIAGLIAKIEPMTETGQQLLEEARTKFGEFSARTTDILDLSRTQLGRVDEILSEATTRTRTQMDRIEMVLDDTVNRFQETTTLLQSGILRPLRQLNAITAGVRTALAVLTSGRRTSVEQATHDEEMFI